MRDDYLNRKRVARRFSLAAAGYDAHAALQREAAERLDAHLEFTRLAPARILDVGCGTGFLTRLLRRRYRRARIVGVDVAHGMNLAARRGMGARLPWQGRTCFATADAARLPFPDGAFDLVASNLTMQWVGDPEAMMMEMRRVLAPGGLLLFSTFGRRTLAELRRSLAGIRPEHAGLVLPFPDVTSLGDALARLPVETPVTDTDLFTLTYPDFMALVRELKGMGASASAIAGRPGGLYGRGLLRRLQAEYERRYRLEDGRVKASFEVLYAQAWHREAPPTFERTIPIEAA